MAWEGQGLTFFSQEKGILEDSVQGIDLYRFCPDDLVVFLPSQSSFVSLSLAITSISITDTLRVDGKEKHSDTSLNILQI